MRVLELYPFGNGLGQAFTARGHHVVVVDFKSRKDWRADLIVTPENLAAFAKEIRRGSFDLVLARPFCTTYSPASRFMHYRDAFTGRPLTPVAREADALVRAELAVIRRVNPRYGWVLENPHGTLRKCAFMADIPVITVTLCQYGHPVRKATDLFGLIPEAFKPRACAVGDDCHIHSNWKRKSGRVFGDALRKTFHSPFLRATLPYKLSFDLCRAFETLNGRVKT